VGGRVKSGVSIATMSMGIDFADPAGAAELIGNVMAHETGHYLGLFHTSDAFLNVEDQFTDTFTNDPANIMVPADGHNGKFSPMQGQRMRAHPLIEN
jgi:hypothetical protein